MNPSRLHRWGAAVAVLLLLTVSGLVQRSLNRDRLTLGVTRGEALGRTAPPALVFTTVALGGFRGLIANALWIRAIDLQEQDKYFEKVQLADWITQLQPHFVTVWIVQAWDMAYNISVKFKNHADRWLWVKRGLELLRDQALKYNPDEPLIYRELAWFFQHKMGANLDDAHFLYKSSWAAEMSAVLAGTNYTALIHPQTDDERERARRLRDVYKMDPETMLEVDQEYGPLEWRLPETHAVYWSVVGFKKSKQKDLINLRRTIYQPLQTAFQRGRLIEISTPEGRRYQFGPNLAMIPSANKAYERMAADDAEFRGNIQNAHKNFLKDAVYFLYASNRRPDATAWYDYLLKAYPDALFTDARTTNQATVRIADLSVDQYAAARVTEDVAETSVDRMTANLQGLLVTSFFALATDQDDEAIGHERLAQVAWDRFMRQLKDPTQRNRIGLAPFDQIKRDALSVFEQTYDPALVARLRTRLGLPPVPPPAAGTNTPAPPTPAQPTQESP